VGALSVATSRKGKHLRSHFHRATRWRGGWRTGRRGGPPAHAPSGHPSCSLLLCRMGRRRYTGGMMTQEDSCS